MSDINWKKRASTVIKTEITKKDIGYDELSDKLKELGIDETAGNIANKLSRGTFSFSFALQIFEALELKNLNLKDY